MAKRDGLETTYWPYHQLYIRRSSGKLCSLVQGFISSGVGYRDKYDDCMLSLVSATLSLHTERQKGLNRKRDRQEKGLIK